MVKDPPDYVAIDPCLIYGGTELPPEIHLRLLQIVGWMWVTKRNGKPLGVKVEELAERWGVADRTAYHTLQTLGAHGYLTIHYSRGWTYLQRGPAITDPETQAARGGNNTPGEPAAGRERRQPHIIHNRHAMPLHENGETSLSRAMPLHTPNSSIVVDVDHTLDPKTDHQQTINTTNGDVQQACIEAGFWEDVALEMSMDPWVTPERVQRTVAALQGQQERGETIGGRRIGNIAALAAANLRRHQEPPAPEPGSSIHRFVESKYADQIEY